MLLIKNKPSHLDLDLRPPHQFGIDQVGIEYCKVRLAEKSQLARLDHCSGIGYARRGVCSPEDSNFDKCQVSKYQL